MMPDPADERNPLSCMKCKTRKIRCSRLMPECDRCRTLELDCVYPTRQERRKARPQLEALLSGASNETLNLILERLQRVEAQCNTLPPQDVSDTSPHTAESCPATLLNYATPSPSSSTAESEYRIDPTLREQSASAVNAIVILKDAIDAVHKLRLHGYASAVITEEIKIPPELAKLWIQNYFTYMPTDMFLSLINRKVIEAIPDVLGLPHIQIDPAVIVIYHGVLYYGCALSAGEDMSHADAMRYAKLTYMACLRSIPGWQRKVSGVVVDLIAAITMARVSAECFDYEMAWRMYQQGCEYAQGLGLHHLDSGPVSLGVHNPNITDNDRRGFWELIQADTLLRLVFDKPPTITGNPWEVNLPWLDASDQGTPKALAAMVFLISSRITLVLLRFFAMIDEGSMSSEQMLQKTEEMCQELTSLYDEWKLHEWTKDTRDPKNNWMVADIALNGYTCVVFMLRRAAMFGSDFADPTSPGCGIPDSPTAIDAARHIVRIISGILSRYPNSKTLSSTFGSYRGYVATAYLVNHVLQAQELEPFEEDIASLVNIGSCLEEIVRTDRGFIPLARAFQRLNAEIGVKLNV